MEELILQAQIQKATQLHTRHGQRLARDPRIQAHLTDYRHAIRRTNRLMEENGVVWACSACAAQGGGSCCFPEVAQWYDPILLLINLLMGVTMPVSPEVPGHCLFVGSTGCKLVARYPFCVNYLCPGLREMLGPSLTREFSAVAGQELSCGWEVELAIQTWLRADP